MPTTNYPWAPVDSTKWCLTAKSCNNSQQNVALELSTPRFDMRSSSSPAKAPVTFHSDTTPSLAGFGLRGLWWWGVLVLSEWRLWVVIQWRVRRGGRIMGYYNGSVQSNTSQIASFLLVPGEPHVGPMNLAIWDIPIEIHDFVLALFVAIV